ncbi:CCR4-NOT transcription complex subunit 4-like [Ornithodoros turicata]|uniref:CCR4-NOT transcription complex subunit 4-like n=1 Tax=Ornithodoros turicata TaxID=34597 RepID=UPI0031394494
MYTMDDQNIECPLCMEPLEMDDINFFPCTCGYQICRFCWHRIRTDENGLCPACRKQYPEDPADFKPLSVEELHKIKNEKRQKDLERKQKLTENRKHLANVRVVQKNLVFVVGLPPRLADTEALKKHDCFGKYGRIHKVVVNHSTSYAGVQGPSASAYVTYFRAEDALRAIHAVNNIKVDGRSLKASLGTTKYCNYFLKSQQCPKTDCMYLHELGDEAASFTKEEMQHGKHQEYERKLHDQIVGCSSNATKKNKAGSRKGNIPPRHTRHIATRSKMEESQAEPDNPETTPPHDQEDDLGFDPWDESSKGLADLLEKEANVAPTRHNMLPHGFRPFADPMLRRPPPPPGFTRSTLPPFFEPPKPTNMAELYTLRESQEALRSLLPNVNITFGPPGQPPPSAPWETSWLGPDPAILTRGGLADTNARF